jgi:hypothetical protein
MQYYTTVGENSVTETESLQIICNLTHVSSILEDLGNVSAICMNYLMCNFNNKV